MNNTIMEISVVSVRVLAVYLSVVTILGNVSKILVFVAAAHVSVDRSFLRCGGSGEMLQNCFDKISQNGLSSSSEWNFIVIHSVTVFETSFPVANNIIENGPDFHRIPIAAEQNSTDKGNNKLDNDISISAILLTLLSSFILLRGTWQMEYSSCQFWYYIQVGSLLLSCIKIVIVTLMGLWTVVTNVALISIFFALIQLWLVQNFMENLTRLAENARQKKCFTKIFAMSDFDLESCQFYITNNKANSNS